VRLDATSAMGRAFTGYRAASTMYGRISSAFAYPRMKKEIRSAWEA